LFDLNSKFSPAGDQAQAIDKLSGFINNNSKFNILEGVTGSGKTFTMANVIKNTKKPTLIMTHNKTLAAQLYNEFKNFFPNNHVEYFISYYDYYQPEAYIPRSDLFIEKDSSINDELDRLRLSATASILSYDDVICIASVSAIYGLGDPSMFAKVVANIEINQSIHYKKFLLQLVNMGYKRNDATFDRGDFRINGDAIDIYPSYFDKKYIHIELFGDEIEHIDVREYMTNKKIKPLNRYMLYATTQFVTDKKRLVVAIRDIELELKQRLKQFKDADKMVEAQRLKSRVEFDLEMMESVGVCKGIENYSRHLSDQKEGEAPYTLLDYFDMICKDYLLIVDESHVSLPQFRGMYAGDRSRKENLVDYGFRLPSALDNRPLRFEEFISKVPQFLFVSATPAEQEMTLSKEHIATQVIRPTGLLDPVIEIKPLQNQIETLFDEIKKTISKGDRVLITTLTKKMAEELTNYYLSLGIKIKYMHSDIDVPERMEIIIGLRRGLFDVLVGINLLREGLDLPEVSLVAILDADKEGFLRSKTSLIQTMGRGARHQEGRVILFADKITNSMDFAIKTTNKRRDVQIAHNKKHNITPKSVKRNIDESLSLDEEIDLLTSSEDKEKMPASERRKLIDILKKKMKVASSNLEFEEAIRLREEISRVSKL
jgi:excinuclease ABC subunit B